MSNYVEKFKKEYLDKLNDVNILFEEITEIYNDEFSFLSSTIPEELFEKLDLINDNIIWAVPDITPQLTIIMDNLSDSINELSNKNKDESYIIIKKTEELWGQLEPQVIEWANNL
ncbi:MAG: hypothetical protein IJJ11_01910 [Methanosphaera sp.]|nr:hypothetical protein [Methanosphaera sp.]